MLPDITDNPTQFYTYVSVNSVELRDWIFNNKPKISFLATRWTFLWYIKYLVQDIKKLKNPCCLKFKFS